MMATGALSGLLERAKALGSGFGAYSAFGSFVLYAVGYLVLRFHLTALGVGTDLSVLDERYLFAGANFLIYIGTTIPIALLTGAFAAALVYGLYRPLPTVARRAVSEFARRRLASADTRAIVGIALALAVIQIVMRKCFFFTNLLVKPELPSQAGWMTWLWVNDGYLPLYFSGLLLGLLVPLALWAWPVAEGPQLSPGLRWKRGLLGTLIAIQAFLLPVNYGVLVFDNALPQTASLGAEALAAGDRAWLVWEGKETATYLVSRQGQKRSLVALPRADSKRIEIVGYASLPVLLRPVSHPIKEQNANEPAH
jgi:hypothetical protein